MILINLNIYFHCLATVTAKLTALDSVAKNLGVDASKLTDAAKVFDFLDIYVLLSLKIKNYIKHSSSITSVQHIRFFVPAPFLLEPLKINGWGFYHFLVHNGLPLFLIQHINFLLCSRKNKLIYLYTY